jgi:putative tricarboxylic transport membrane protein
MSDPAMAEHTKDDSGTAARASVPEIAVAIGVVALGVFTIVDAHRITVPLSSNAVGPRVFPYAVGVALIVAGLGVVLAVLRGEPADPEGGEDIDVNAPTDWLTLAKVVAGLTLHIVLVDRLGWALSGALLFTIVAWALGASAWRAAIVGVVLGFVVQALFVSGLGVSLPAGIFDRVSLLNG